MDNNWLTLPSYIASVSVTLLTHSIQLTIPPVICVNPLFSPGGSSGAAMDIAIKAAREYGMKKGQKVVVVMPDSIRDYM